MIWINSYLCNMKRKIFIFILFIIGLATYADKPINFASDHVALDDFNQYEIEISSIHDSNSSISRDNEFDNPVRSIILAYCNNIQSRHMRTINRCMRLIHRSYPISFLKERNILNFIYFSHYLQSNCNVFCFVKLSGNHCFIHFRKLQI